MFRRRTLRRALKLQLFLIPIIFMVPIALYIILAYIVAGDARLFPSPLRHAKSLLVVTAHPEDECLFFAPSIFGVLDRSFTRGGLVVLSLGDERDHVERRKWELEGSCEALGIDEDRCVYLDKPDLRYDSKVRWDEDAIMLAIKEYIKRWRVDALITFDEAGISGHINHRAVGAAIRHYASADPHAPTTYVLRSTSFLRQYSSLGDLPLTSLRFGWRIIKAMVSPSRKDLVKFNDEALFVSSWRLCLKTREALQSYTRQSSWDRTLYLLFNRHVWFNDLARVEKSTTKERLAKK